jgi:hypothetical protein
MGRKKGTNRGKQINYVFNSEWTRLNITQKIWKWILLLNLQSSSFQSFLRLPSSTRPLVIPLQSILICMEHYSVFPNLGIHFKPTLPLVGKIWKKFSLLLLLMATAKKKFIAIRRKLDFSDRREKKLNAIWFSRARARFQTLGRYCRNNWLAKPRGE